MMVKQKNNLAAKVKEDQALRSSLPALSRQILELAKTRGEITGKEIDESTGANRNTIKVHFAKAGERQLPGASRHPWRTLHTEVSHAR
jgi:predicted HTH transcriptional regulator